MVQSKQKGNKFELEIYRLLKDIDPEIKRSIGSGNSKDEKADLFSPEMIIECKHHKKLSPKQIEQFWDKVVREGHINGLNPVLVVKENYKPEVVFMFNEFGRMAQYDLFFLQFLIEFYRNTRHNI